ncbi:subtilisin family serine protease [Pontibacter aydingkolensis]|uniref:S8 family peptidase n=1 Tax=Pontibacter aydingkolensis TaxID=1911536 RepID=A0ABS7CNM0_9BACT|nr:S8 family peptidase [Pontibacter aydingkolensis]MBW7465450.1 S8 family peptidase [Pontibacter aydingkolensis]
MKTNLSRNFKATAAFLLLSGSVAFAQDGGVSSVSDLDKAYHNWYNLDAKLDKIPGVSVNRAYNELLISKQPRKKVVVAVIDSGTDINHEELQGKIWVNKNEIPGNGIDDDNNGYIDDVNGWGFLGNAAGENIEYETYEYVRLLRKLAPKYKNVTSAQGLSEAELKEYNTYLTTRKNYEKELDEKLKTKQNLDAFGEVLAHCEALVTKHLEKDTYTVQELKAISSTDVDLVRAKTWLVTKYNQGFTRESFIGYKAHIDKYVNYHLNLDFNPRTIVADNPTDINDNKYGNSNVIGPRADHGTPVSGIIAGIRGNGVGVDGIAENVEIMVLRAVPSGDEYDKDIALAIRYAVDNGANIINMSFGKDFSPEKHFVDEAVKYAESKNVLLVHAAGNDSKNIDNADNFPTKQLLDGTRSSTWLEVGATSKNLDKTFIGTFSNYGQKNVDLFAPGVDLILLAPDNKYDQMDGTSFASPVVSGVAALVWSYYPELTALELKDVLLQSSVKYPKLKVYYPTEEKSKKTTKFSTLSASGGVVNAFEALKLAERVVQEKNL